MAQKAIAPARMMRIMKLTFIGAGLLLVFVVMRIPASPTTPVNSALELSITAIALVEVVVGFLAPRLFGRMAKRTTAGQPGSTPLAQWMKVNLISLACFYSCMLFGIVLHFVGGRTAFVDFALAAGLISLLLWKPQPPPTTQDTKPLQS